MCQEEARKPDEGGEINKSKLRMWCTFIPLKASRWSIQIHHDRHVNKGRSDYYTNEWRVWNVSRQIGLGHNRGHS